ncbi:hypothetical protein BST24_27020 [Mycobacteroides franklinii]|nr:hypothetical protein BST24_27020 [Mycobacteroides franklinii]
MVAATVKGVRGVDIETPAAAGSSKWPLQQQYQRYRDHADGIAESIVKFTPDIVVMSSPESIVLSGNSGIAPRRSYAVGVLVVSELVSRGVNVVLIGAKNLREVVLGAPDGTPQTAEQMRASAAGALGPDGLVKHGDAAALAMVGTALLDVPAPWATRLKGTLDVEKLELPHGFADTKAELESVAKAEAMKARAAELASMVKGSTPDQVKAGIAEDAAARGFDPDIYAALVHAATCT